jgi:streptogramin lyase
MRIAFRSRYLPLAFAAALLSDCSGGGGVAIPTTSARPGLIAGNVVVIVSKPVSPSSRARPQYISPSAVSLSITISGVAAPTVAEIGPGASDCTGGATRTCTIHVSAPLGNDTFTISQFDGPNATGTLLGSGSTTVTVTPAAFAVTVTLDGTVASITIAFANLPPAGSPGTATVVVMAKDADGNTIVGPGNYTLPITLTDNDLSGATTLSTTSVTGPGVSVTLNYNGAHHVVAMISASASGIAPASAPFSPVPTVTNEYTVPTANSQPFNITPSPDGTLYFSESFFGVPSKIARITTSGAITEYTTPAAASKPFGIAARSDGTVWFAEAIVYPGPSCANPGAGGSVAELSGGTITEFPIPTVRYPGYVAPGGDGNIWFTETPVVLASVQCNPGAVAKVTPAGIITEYPIPGTTGIGPIAAGPDGRLWFTENNDNRIGAITTGGTISEYAIPTPASDPMGIAAGSDGALWFTERVANKIGRITTSGAITEYPIPTAGAYARQMTLGPDNNIWFAEQHTAQIGRITPSGQISEYPVPGALDITDVATGSDGNIWFVDLMTNTVGKLVY